MLERIVTITFVAVLSLALTGQSIAETKNPRPGPWRQQILQQLTQGASSSSKQGTKAKRARKAPSAIHGAK
jgi:hypothetical protein